MACDVYDLVYYKVLTIAIYDMQFENTEVQQLMWTKLNEMMLKHGFLKSNFKGFMADITQTNWNVVRIIYGYGYPLLRWLIRRTLVYSNRVVHLINTPNN
jgi:hypothetical protein